jgi:hypothetical protein
MKGEPYVPADNAKEPWTDDWWIERTRLLLNSYEKWTGRRLIERSGDAAEDSRRLYEAPFVVVSHGTEADPILNFGNATALALWEMTLPEFTGTPSRKTAEPLHRDERARMLEETRRKGFIDDYQGIRIASTGKRFRIDQATVWNVVDDEGRSAGQAATFAEWVFLER